MAVAIRGLYSQRIIDAVHPHTRQAVPFEPLPAAKADAREHPLEKACVDLSLIGIDLLSNLGPAIYGSKWVDSWAVIREVYRKEHRYGGTLGDIASALSEYDAESERVLSIGPVTPLGPWCVKWWQRYDKGYRIEVEIGERVRPETSTENNSE